MPSGRELSIVVPGPSGVPLFGILHEPEHPRVPRTGISLLNPGLKSRVAPNRLNVLLARRLASLGYFVLRIDPQGVGDSGGDLPEEPLLELWQRVQKGEFLEAARSANRVFVRECALDELIGMGNCGGAITALFEAEVDPLVRRLVLMDVPVTLRDTDPEAGRIILGKRHGAKVLRGYWRRARDWKAWFRLLTLKSDVRTVARAARARFLSGSATKPNPNPPVEGTEPEVASSEAADPRLRGEVLSPLFMRAMLAFHQKGGRALFVNAGDYDNTFLFDTLFGIPYMANGSGLSRGSDLAVVPGANHVYGAPKWRQCLIDTIEAWLEERPPTIVEPRPDLR